MKTYEKYLKNEINEGYTSNELKGLDNTWLINAQFRDDSGNVTKWLGLNDAEALKALKVFVDQRIKMLPEIKKKKGY
jgi:hypothetical protein